MVTEVNGTSGDDSILIPDLYPDSTDTFEIKTFLGADTIVGGDGDDVIRSGKSDDTVDGGAGDDVINGGKGNDTLLGGDGDDTISGGKHDDVVSGGLGSDDLEGNLGNDILKGGKGADVIYGGAGDDMIYGNKGNNELYGGSGQDFIDTGKHTSVVNGGTGEDVIRAYIKNGGDHTLTGGADADTFEFYAVAQKKVSDVTITDFELGLDAFSISGVSDDDFMTDVLAGASSASLSVEGDDLVLQVNSKFSVTFEDIEMADFVAAYSDALIT